MTLRRNYRHPAKCASCGLDVLGFIYCGGVIHVDVEPIPSTEEVRGRRDLWQLDPAWGWSETPMTHRLPVHRWHSCQWRSYPSNKEKPKVTTPQDVDEYAAGEKAPALSFKNAPVGTSYTGTVTVAPTTVQSIDFESGDKATWPDGNPKMAVVLGLEVNGEARSLWAAKPSAMLKACSDAQVAAGERIKVGGTVTVTFIGEKPNEKNPRLNPQKLYSVTYLAPNAFASSTPANSVPAGAGAPPF